MYGGGIFAITPYATCNIGPSPGPYRIPIQSAETQENVEILSSYAISYMNVKDAKEAE